MDQLNNHIDLKFKVKLQNICYDTSIQILVGLAWFFSEALFLPSIDKEVVGIIFVRLELLRQTIIFSRPAFRCNRIVEKHGWTNVVNFTWLGVLIVSISSCIFCFIWLGNLHWLQLPSEKYLQDYQLAVKTISASCVIETFLEPAYLISKTFMFGSNWKTYVEKAPGYFRIMIIVVTVNYFPGYTIRALAYGELATSTIILVVHWVYILFKLRKKVKQLKKEERCSSKLLYNFPVCSVREILPRNVFSSQPFLDREVVRIALSFLEMDANRLLHDNGEKYAMTIFPALSFAEQGIYIILATAGQRVKQCIFYSMEEHSFFYYAPKLKPSSNLQQRTQRTKQISDSVFKFLRITALTGCSVLVFGLSYSHLFSQKYAGNVLVEWPGSLLIKLQCLVVFFKGIEAGTGSYAALVTNNIGNYYHDMGFRSLTYVPLFVSGILSYLIGSFGFVLGNCCKFGWLILHNLRLIRRDFQDIPENPLLGLVPNKTEAFALGTALAVTLFSEWFIYPFSVKLHLAFGVLSAAFVIESIVCTELSGWNQVYSFLLQTFLG